MQLTVLRLPKRLQEDSVFRQRLWNFEEFIGAIVLECPFQKILRRCWPTAQLSAPEQLPQHGRRAQSREEMPGHSETELWKNLRRRGR